MTRGAAAAAMVGALAALAGCGPTAEQSVQFGRETALATECEGAEAALAAAFRRAGRGAYSVAELILLGDLDAEKRGLCTAPSASGLAVGRVREIAGEVRRIGGGA